MNASIFEGFMLLCFGVAWPFSIYKTWKTKKSTGKSFIFLFIIFCGYLSGILFKIYGSLDKIIILYICNASLVATDIFLTFNVQKKPESRKKMAKLEKTSYKKNRCKNGKSRKN